MLNGTGITPQNSNENSNNNLTDDAMKVRDQAFTIPRVAMLNDKDNYALKFELDKKRINTDNINAEPVFVKKIAGKRDRDCRSRSRVNTRARM